MMSLRTRLPCLLTLLLILPGCGSTPVSRFYLLTPTETTATGTALYGEPHIGVGPVTLPEYLDRSQLVTRTANAEIYLAETERWAEPLQENFTRVLVENLSRNLGTGRISIEPSRNHGNIDYRVTADVLQFDADESGKVILITYWNIQDGSGKNLTGMQKSEIQIPASRPADPASTVSQLSAAVAELSREIASGLIDLSTAAAGETSP